MTTHALSALTTGVGVVLLAVVVVALLGRELRRQARPPGRHGRPRRASGAFAIAVTAALGADVVVRFVTLAHA